MARLNGDVALSLDLHRRAEELMLRADEALLRGDADEARQAFSQAADFELEAIATVPSERVRTRGILVMSAVSLLRRGGRVPDALSLAYRLLSQAPIADWVTNQLESTLDELRSERRAQLAGYEVTPHVFEWALKGPAIFVGEGPMGLVLQKIDQVMKYGTRVGEWLGGFELRRTGPPPRAARELMGMTLSEPLAGSFRFRVKLLRKSVQTEMFASNQSRPDATRVAAAYLDVLQAASEPESQRLADLVPQEDYREAFLQLVRSLAPDGKQVTSVEVADTAATAAGRPTKLSRHTAITIRDHMLAARPVGQEETYEDILRALDLNHGWISLGEPERVRLHVDKASPVLEDVVGPLVNRQVRVLAYRKRQRLVIRDIEPTGTDDTQ